MSGTDPQGAPKNEDTCIICLQEDGTVFSFPCKCRATLHIQCWDEYCSNKAGKMECLICHKDFTKSVKDTLVSNGNKSLNNGIACCCCSCLIGALLLQFL